MQACTSSAMRRTDPAMAFALVVGNAVSPGSILRSLSAKSRSCLMIWGYRWLGVTIWVGLEVETTKRRETGAEGEPRQHYVGDSAESHAGGVGCNFRSVRTPCTICISLLYTVGTASYGDFGSFSSDDVRTGVISPLVRSTTDAVGARRPGSLLKRGSSGAS